MDKLHIAADPKYLQGIADERARVIELINLLPHDLRTTKELLKSYIEGNK